jgi:hypothetical protein
MTDEQLAQQRQEGRSYDQIAQAHGLSKDSVRSRVSRYNRLQQQIIDLQEQVDHLKNQTIDLYEPSARDINDLDKWRMFINSARQSPNMLKVQFWPDLHIPDTNWQVVEIAYQIAQEFQPDLHLFLGDEYDFDTLSTHWPRAENRRRVDAFKEVARDWHSIQDRLSQITPHAKRAMIGGNHTRGRVEAYVNEKAPEVADTLIEVFIDLVRSNNRVMWLGWEDEMWLSDLHIEHGTRTGENSAKNSLKDLGWASPRVGAHVHSPSWYVNYTFSKNADLMSVSRHIVESMTLPCMCMVHPHYASNKKKSRWVNGLGTGHINLNGNDVHLQKIICHQRTDGSMITVFGGRVYEYNSAVAQIRGAA